MRSVAAPAAVLLLGALGGCAYAEPAVTEPAVTEPAAGVRALLDDPVATRPGWAGEVPFRVWTASLAPGDTGAGLPAGGSDPARRQVRLRVHSRLPGDTRDTVRDRVLTLHRTGGRWRAVENRPIGDARDLWDLGPVRVAQGRRSLVLAAAAVADPLAPADVDATAAQVDRVWGTAWRRTVVVLQPARDADAALLTGRAGAGVAGLAAVTTGSVTTGSVTTGSVTTGTVTTGTVTEGTARDGDERVVLVPGGWHDLSAPGRRLVLAHELSHVASRSGARFAVPRWFEECLADAVGLAAAGLTPAQLFPALPDAVRAAPPSALPATADFDRTAGSAESAYALSWPACRVLAGATTSGRPGTERLTAAQLDRLVSVHRVATGTRPATPGSRPATSARQAWVAALAVAGLDERRLLDRWRRELGRPGRIGP